MIEQFADPIVTGPAPRPTEYGRYCALWYVAVALVLQKRRRLGEKDAEGAQGGILDGVAGVWPLGAMVSN